MLAPLLILLAATSSTAAPAQWDFKRAAVVISGQAAVFEHQGIHQSVFLPQIGLSYNLTSGMNLVAICERDFQSKLTVGRVGARFLLSKIGPNVALGAGADVVTYADDGRAALSLHKDTSWQASLDADVVVARYKPAPGKEIGPAALFLVGSLSHDVQNELSTARIALRYQAVGGRP